MTSEQFSSLRCLRPRGWSRRSVLVAALPFVVSLQAPAQTLLIDSPTVDAGMVQRGAAITKEFSVKNSGTADLHILDVKPTCGCMVAKFDKTIRPGAEGKITLTIDTKSFRSPISKTATVSSNDPVNPQATLIVIANVRGYVTALPSEFLRIQTTSGQTGAAELTLVSDHPDFKPTVTATGPYLRATLAPDQQPKRWKLTLISDSSAPAGLLGGAVIVQTGISQEPQMRLPVSGVVMRLGEAGQAGGAETAKASEPALTNQEVVKLVAAELGDEIVIAKIKNAPVVQLDVSTDALLALKAQKISKAVVAAMIERASAPPRATATHASAAGVSQPPPKPVATSPCAGVEAMGLYKNEIFGRAMGGGVTEWIAKIRNNTAVTKIVVFSWRDQYGEEKASQVQIGGGEIASARVDMTEAKFIAPVRDLQLKSCQ